jgi:hypothetical protein
VLASVSVVRQSGLKVRETALKVAEQPARRIPDSCARCEFRAGVDRRGTRFWGGRPWPGLARKARAGDGGDLESPHCQPETCLRCATPKRVNPPSSAYRALSGAATRHRRRERPPWQAAAKGEGRQCYLKRYMKQAIGRQGRGVQGKCQRGSMVG